MVSWFRLIRAIRDSPRPPLLGQLRSQSWEGKGSKLRKIHGGNDLRKKRLTKRIVEITGHGVPVWCVTPPARLFVNRFTMNLRISSAANSAMAPSTSGPKIHAGKGLVPKIALPQGV